MIKGDIAVKKKILSDSAAKKWHILVIAYLAAIVVYIACFAIFHKILMIGFLTATLFMLFLELRIFIKEKITRQSKEIEQERIESCIIKSSRKTRELFCRVKTIPSTIMPTFFRRRLLCKHKIRPFARIIGNVLPPKKQSVPIFSYAPFDSLFAILDAKPIYDSGEVVDRIAYRVPRGVHDRARLPDGMADRDRFLIVDFFGKGMAV